MLVSSTGCAADNLETEFGRSPSNAEFCQVAVETRDDHRAIAALNNFALGLGEGDVDEQVAVDKVQLRVLKHTLREAHGNLDGLAAVEREVGRCNSANSFKYVAE